ncbi:sjoegren syndrome nuclear autoantigen 1 [Holotrichia oblita]|uniref:Sjoegren syndrome nuclear autoantigen 1 n=1 Tax=Holotrichia oblita TaxID=644536 RepID=A0ACB9SJI1_HOLOL|nr:sjoegren syndrome nuclear autoantigen 1 [Holotrichia oblita]
MSKPHVKTIVYQRYASRSDEGREPTSRSAIRLTRSPSPQSNSHLALPDHNVLRSNNDEISKYLILLKEQRDELTMLIEKQESEKKQLKTEIARLKYKFKLVTKSLNQRIMTYERYDQTIKEAETLFKKIVVSSDTLLGAVRKDAGALEETINKKVGTEISKLPPKKILSQPPSASQIKTSKYSPSQQGTMIQQRTAFQAINDISEQKMDSHLNFAFQEIAEMNNQEATIQHLPNKQQEEPQREESGPIGRIQPISSSYPKLTLFGLGHVDSIDYI